MTVKLQQCVGKLCHFLLALSLRNKVDNMYVYHIYDKHCTLNTHTTVTYLSPSLKSYT